MNYFFTKYRQIVNENSEKIPLDQPSNPLTINFIAWQQAGGTIEESDIILPEEIEAEFEAQIAEFINKKKIDGAEYFDVMEAQITKVLFSMERTLLMNILVEINSTLYKPLKLMRSGDFASALAIFQQPLESENELIIEKWNEARNFCVTYYLENYPR